MCENCIKKNQRKSWLNSPPKLLACVGFLYEVVHKSAVSESSIALARLNLKEKFGLFVDFEFFTEMASWGTD